MVEISAWSWDTLPVSWRADLQVWQTFTPKACCCRPSSRLVFISVVRLKLPNLQWKKRISQCLPHWWRKVSPAVVFIFFSSPFLSSLRTNPASINHIHPYPILQDWNYFLKVGDTVHYSSLLPSKPTNWKEITNFEQTPHPQHTPPPKTELKEVLTTKLWSPKVCFNRDSSVNSCSARLYDRNCSITRLGNKVFGVAVYIVFVIFH